VAALKGMGGGTLPSGGGTSTTNGTRTNGVPFGNPEAPVGAGGRQIAQVQRQTVDRTENYLQILRSVQHGSSQGPAAGWERYTIYCVGLDEIELRPPDIT